MKRVGGQFAHSGIIVLPTSGKIGKGLASQSPPSLGDPKNQALQPATPGRDPPLQNPRSACGRDPEGEGSGGKSHFSLPSLPTKDPSTDGDSRTHRQLSASSPRIQAVPSTRWPREPTVLSSPGVAAACVARETESAPTNHPSEQEKGSDLLPNIHRKSSPSRKMLELPQPNRNRTASSTA